MYVAAYQPYEPVSRFTNYTKVRPVSAISQVSSIVNNTDKPEQTDVELFEAVDPVFEGEPGHLLDVYV